MMPRATGNDNGPGGRSSPAPSASSQRSFLQMFFEATQPDGQGPMPDGCGWDNHASRHADNARGERTRCCTGALLGGGANWSPVDAMRSTGNKTHEGDP
jgi:hypothetical protein